MALYNIYLVQYLQKMDPELPIEMDEIDLEVYDSASNIVHPLDPTIQMLSSHQDHHATSTIPRVLPGQGLSFSLGSSAAAAMGLGIPIAPIPPIMAAMGLFLSPPLAIICCLGHGRQIMTNIESTRKVVIFSSDLRAALIKHGQFSRWPAVKHHLFSENDGQILQKKCWGIRDPLSAALGYNMM